jgi:hypothetical protein
VCEGLVQAKSLDDLGDANPNFLNQIEEKLDHYVELVDMAHFAFMFRV